MPVMKIVPLTMYFGGYRFIVGEADLSADPPVAVLFYEGEFAHRVEHMIGAELGHAILFEPPQVLDVAREIELTPCGKKLEVWIRTY